jgi:hypothetical protein
MGQRVWMASMAGLALLACVAQPIRVVDPLSTDKVRPNVRKSAPPVSPGAGSTEPGAGAAGGRSPGPSGDAKSTLPSAGGAGTTAGANGVASATASVTPSSTPTPKPVFVVSQGVAPERPTAIANYDTGTVTWNPAPAVLTWKVTAPTDLTLTKVNVRFRTDSSLLTLGYRLRQTDPTPTPTPVPSPSTMDTGFVPLPNVSPSQAAGGSPSPTPLPGLDLTLQSSGTPEALGVGAKLPVAKETPLTLALEKTQAGEFIRTKKPLNVVHVEVTLETVAGPVTAGDLPVKLVGQFVIK